MKKQLVTLLIIFSIILSFSIPVGATAERKSVIVVFKNTPDAGLIRAHGGDIKYQYDIIPGIAVNMPVTALKGLQNHPNIAYIEDDIQVHAQVEILPWGVNRIDADKVWDSDGNMQTDTDANTGAGVNIAVLDTGIDADHPDLYANVKGGISFVSNPRKWDDDNGHGTHVAGTIAAMDNDIGVIGVAPDASLYGVKVLDRSGSGYLSDVIAGMDWARTNNMDIITMSLSTVTHVSTFEDACNNVYTAGVVIVAAAGNGYGNSVNYPAAYASVVAVSATNDDDSLASYSNVGPEIEMAAPGSSIYSTYKGGIYATMSGTSMATPHVTGVAALVIASDVEYRGNPADVRAQLTSTAEDLDSTGWDSSFGYGLVDAENATPPTTVTPPLEPTPLPTEDEMHIANISMSYDTKSAGPNSFTWGLATVTVVNSNGSPVSGAQVTGTWSGLTSDIDVAPTGTDGKVTLRSDSEKNLASGMFTFTVDEVTHSGFTYNASANVENQGSITVP